jgi:predicted nucleic acid-binding protein
VTSCFDSNVLIDYFDGIVIAGEELSYYDRVLISRVTWMEVLVGGANRRTKSNPGGFSPAVCGN